MWKMKSSKNFQVQVVVCDQYHPPDQCAVQMGYTIPGELGYGFPAVRLDGVGCRLTAVHQLSNRVSPVVAQGVLNR